MLLGVTPAWTLFALPMALAVPLGGPQGLAAATVVAALMCALASGRDGTDGMAMALGLAAFAAAGIAVGAGHRAQERAAARIADESMVDALTGLYKYAFFEEALARECRRAGRYGCRCR